MHDLRLLIDNLTSAPWAIRPEKLNAITGVLKAHLEGSARLTAIDATAEKLAREQSRKEVTEELADDATIVGVIPIHGTIFPRSSFVTDFFGLTTTTSIKAQLDAFMGNDKVNGIILDVDSPGGMVTGVPELADAIFAAAQDKPIIAHVWGQCCSAGYWLASQADSIVASRSSEIGSVGVRMMHVDYTKYFEEKGIGVEILRSSGAPNKAEVNPYEPLSDEAREFEIEQLDLYHDQFVDAISRGRGLVKSVVQKTFGNGRVFLVEEAQERRMIDRIASFKDTVEAMVDSFDRRSMLASDLTRRSRRRRFF